MSCGQSSDLAVIGRSLSYQRGLAELGVLFAKAGLAPVVVKGQAITDLANGDRLRQASDVDLLVAEDETAVAETLIRHGYQEHSPPGRRHSQALLGERLFMPKRSTLPPVEIHRFFDKITRRPIDCPGIIQRAQASPYPGLRYPTREDLFLLVVLHASHDQLGDPTRHLDDLELLLTRGLPDLQLVCNRAQEWELSVALDTWMGRLARERGVELPYRLHQDRGRLCQHFSGLSARLPTGAGYLVGQLPWHDRPSRHLRGILNYALLRLWDRIDSP